MTQNILFGICLLLALYGLSCVVWRIIVWLTSPKRGDNCFVVVPITNISQLQDGLMSAEFRSESLGVCRFKKIVAVNFGLDDSARKKFERYCQTEDILYCNGDELSDLIHGDICKRRTGSV